MGVKQLLQLLKPHAKKVRLSQLKHRTAAVDAYSWIHRGLYACATEVLKGEQPSRHLSFIGSYVRMFHALGITLVFVFDGLAYPHKLETNLERKKSREAGQKEARNILRKTGSLTKAAAVFRNFMEVTPTVKEGVLAYLQKENLPFVVSPYESDAQLAFLCREKLVDFVVSEDSDLLLFGCPLLLTKLDQNGCGELFRFDITTSSVGKCLKKDFGVTSEEFLLACVLSGCDYLSKKIRNVGIKKALLFCRETDGDAERVLVKIRADNKYDVPVGFADSLRRAVRGFLHHPVFDPIEKKVVPLNGFEVSKDQEACQFWNKFEVCTVLEKLSDRHGTFCSSGLTKRLNAESTRPKRTTQTVATKSSYVKRTKVQLTKSNCVC